MANMAYCRFQNTLQDLRDCQRALNEMGDFERELSGEEARAAKRLLQICRELSDDYDMAPAASATPTEGASNAP